MANEPRDDVAEAIADAREAAGVLVSPPRLPTMLALVAHYTLDAIEALARRVDGQAQSAADARWIADRASKLAAEAQDAALMVGDDLSAHPGMSETLLKLAQDIRHPNNNTERVAKLTAAALEVLSELPRHADNMLVDGDNFSAYHAVRRAEMAKVLGQPGLDNDTALLDAVKDLVYRAQEAVQAWEEGLPPGDRPNFVARMFALRALVWWGQ